MGRLLAFALLFLFYALALGTTLTKSPTVDEPIHVLRGVVLGQTGQLHLQYEHAPLSHRIIGLFLTTEDGIPEVQGLPSWPTSERTQIARELVWGSGLDVERVFFLGRLPLVWLGMLLGAMIGSWALSWLGRRAMVVSLVLFSVSPNLLASSALATTDLAATAFYFGTVYCWWRTFKYESKRWLLLTAVLLGFAMATKLTALLLLPVLLFLALIHWRERPWAELLIKFLALLPVALIAFWLIYGFELARLEEFLIPLPAASYARSWLNVLNHVQSGHAAFFLGELSMEGWWLYFPVTFLLKTPVVTLSLLIVGSWIIIRDRDYWQTGVFLLAPALAIIIPAMVSRLNIGYRHILPASPFIMVAAGAAVLFFQRNRLTKALLILGLSWILLSGIYQYPDYLAYFNEIAGGTDQGFRYLGDSNLDWGQDLRSLAEQMKESDQTWRISYAGVGEPAYYDISQDQLLEAGWKTSFSPANPQPGMYALSVNHMQGLLADRDLLDWFRRQEPDGSVGGSILLFQVEEQLPGSWMGQCLDPVPLLTTEEAEQLVGHRDLRHLYFDCRQSLVLPGDGARPGWLIMPQGENWWFQEALTPEAGSKLTLVYRHNPSEYGPSYDIYYWSGGLEGDLLANARNQAETVDGKSVKLPLPANDALSLYSYQSENWISEWSVNKQADQPLSIQAHLYVDGQALPIVGDSLGFSSDQWRAGDRLLQRFDFPRQDNPLYLETGVYNFQTVEMLGDALRLPAE